MGFIQYIKDTRGEMNHVSWPTRTQTTIFTVMVVLLSVFVSLYLGVFDFLFTNALSKGLQLLPDAPAQQIDLTNLSTSTPIQITETPENQQ